MPKRLTLEGTLEDANIAIYIVEGTPKSATVAQLGNPRLCSSYLTLSECSVIPIRDNDQSLILAHEQFFRTLTRIPTRPAIFRLAARLRAHSRLRTPDALHLAYALSAQCTYFLTGDRRIATAWAQLQPAYPALQVVTI